jgi:hypothetical protein
MIQKYQIIIHMILEIKYLEEDNKMMIIGGKMKQHEAKMLIY